LLQRCTRDAADGITPFFMDGEARSKVGYGRETGENMLSSRFAARDPKPTSKRGDWRDRELHPDFYRRSCSRRLRVVISIKGFDSPFVRMTTPALENGASTTAARKPGFSPL